VFTVENETVLDASRAEVWAELSDFTSYSRWSPFVRLEGYAAEGDDIQYSFRRNTSNPHFSTVRARVIKFETARQMVFRVGFQHIFAVEEGYRLSPATKGVRLVHSFRCIGLFSALKLNRAKRNFKKILESTDRRFEQHLKAKKPKATKKAVRKAKRIR